MDQTTEISQPESRVKKTLLNARVNLIFYFLTLALSFVSRKVFLDCLGTEFIGLSGTLQNILGFLNLAELGIGSAIAYTLYKPIFQNNRMQINEIISVMGYLYRWIGSVILIGGIIVSFFLPIIFSDKDLGGVSILVVYCVYFSFLFSSLIGYFINYRQNLLVADQRNYVVTGYFQSASICKTVIQLWLAYQTHNMYLWAFIEFLFGVIYAFILNWKISQTYPWLKSEIKKGKIYLKQYPLIMKNTKRIFLHRIGVVTQFQTTPLLIYAFVTLQMVAYYENYTLLISKISSLLTSVLGSAEAAIGNLIAEGDTTKIKSVLWEMMTLRYWITSLVVVGFYFLLPPFITLWLGSEYLLSNTLLVLIIVNMSIQLTQSVLGNFISGYGLYNDVWVTLTQAGLFLLFAFVGGKFFGLNGIIGSSITTLFLSFCVWKPYYLYRFGLKISLSHYCRHWIQLLIRVGFVILASFYVEPFIRTFNPSSSFVELAIYAVLLMLCALIISVPIMMIGNRYARTVIGRFINIPLRFGLRLK